MSENLKAERTVFVKNESKERIWEVLTTSEYTKRYMFNCEVFTDWKKGSEIKWKGNFLGHKVYTRGVILECTPNEHVQYTGFDPGIGLEDAPENYLWTSFTLTPKDDGIEVKFTVENFGDSEEKLKESERGLDKVIVPGFKKILKIR